MMKYFVTISDDQKGVRKNMFMPFTSYCLKKKKGKDNALPESELGSPIPRSCESPLVHFGVWGDWLKDEIVH